MFRIKEVPSGIMLELTDKDFLLQEFPDLDVGLYEAMEYCDFAPEGTANEEWSDISASIGYAAIGHLIYDDGGSLTFSYGSPYRMFGNEEIQGAEIIAQLVQKGELLFTPFKFRNQYGKEIY
ncbi:hypothetical protein [Pontibacter sp. BAB1700]|uniref:hypothetical protein n=1 Tax=Pontibacter sp. BAB1700 TaxID=1144253 RepID=UPI00026BD644|nr:hypothetical protein [Pontibacter sp. BAB1700]EJF09057.1 hypothetical protein O71_17276 [Pontibacter sp. BAB1700]